MYLLLSLTPKQAISDVPTCQVQTGVIKKNLCLIVSLVEVVVSFFTFLLNNTSFSRDAFLSLFPKAFFFFFFFPASFSFYYSSGSVFSQSVSHLYDEPSTRRNLRLHSVRARRSRGISKIIGCWGLFLSYIRFIVLAFRNNVLPFVDTPYPS